MYADIETIDDVINHLEALLTATKHFKNRCRYKTATAQSLNPVLQKSRSDASNEQALKIFSMYQHQKTSGLKHSQALSVIRTTYELNYDTAEIITIQGRRHFKNLRKEQILSDHTKGLSITELAKKHKMAYNTIKRITQMRSKRLL